MALDLEYQIMGIKRCGKIWAVNDHILESPVETEEELP